MNLLVCVSSLKQKNNTDGEGSSNICGLGQGVLSRDWYVGMFIKAWNLAVCVGWRIVEPNSNVLGKTIGVCPEEPDS